ncbi:MAG: hypothetical protein P8Z80_11690 [Pseudolabrys sp.]|jgi:hypothetical protein
MSVSSIGIQMIEPQTATSSKSTPPSSQDRARENAAFTSEPVTQKPPPPPGMGKLVDKSA